MTLPAFSRSLSPTRTPSIQFSRKHAPITTPRYPRRPAYISSGSPRRNSRSILSHSLLSFSPPFLPLPPPPPPELSGTNNGTYHPSVAACLPPPQIMSRSRSWV